MNRFRFTLTNLAGSSTDVLTNDPIGWDDAVYKMHLDGRCIVTGKQIGRAHV